MTSVTKGNLTGVGALLLWGTLVALIKSISDSFGVSLGTALIYTIGAIVAFIVNGIPKFSLISKGYLFGAGSLFVIYEIVFSQAIAMSVTPQQTLEVGMLNYLWPCMIVLFSIWINNIKLRWIVWPGMALTICGIYFCVAANSSLNVAKLINNIITVPLPYIFGITAAVTWALYSNLSVRWSKGVNGVPIFFSVIALILWIRFFLSGEPFHYPGISPLCQLIFIGCVFSLSYIMWEKGINHGNFIFLAICSYFSPALSMFFATVWLKATPPLEYWFGVGLVVVGSLVCWLSNIRR